MHRASTARTAPHQHCAPAPRQRRAHRTAPTPHAPPTLHAPCTAATTHTANTARRAPPPARRTLAFTRHPRAACAQDPRPLVRRHGVALLLGGRVLRRCLKVEGGTGSL
eukprot:227320-Prymnesium_polylepis.1